MNKFFLCPSARKFTFLALYFLLATTVPQAPAKAAVLEFTGTASELGLSPVINGGDAVTLTVGFNEFALPDSTTANSATYIEPLLGGPLSLGWFLDIGTFSTGGASGEITVINDSGGADILSLVLPFAGTVINGQTAGNDLFFNFADLTGTAFSSTALPAALPAGITFGGSAPVNFTPFATLDLFLSGTGESAAVSEPGPLAVLGVGLAALMALRRRRRA